MSVWDSNAVTQHIADMRDVAGSRLVNSVKGLKLITSLNTINQIQHRVKVLFGIIAMHYCMVSINRTFILGLIFYLKNKIND